MLLIRSEDRGLTKIEWLKSFHSFSFGDYRDPKRMGFSKLRVINDDIIAPGAGFQTHPHRDMEIITYVLSGELSHKDSMGNGSTIYPGEIQMMRAGTGVTHSEFNSSSKEPCHLLQIWVLPHMQGLAPAYFQRVIPKANAEEPLCPLITPDGRDQSLKIAQDASLFVLRLAAGTNFTCSIRPSRALYIHTIRGILVVQDQALKAGDGLGFNMAALEGDVNFMASEDVEALVFDLPQVEPGLL